MDDGGKISSGLKLCTNSFTLKEVKFLSKYLDDMYSLDTSIHKTGVINQYVIYIPKKSINKLKFIVSPFMHSSMKYKLQS